MTTKPMRKVNLDYAMVIKPSRSPLHAAQIEIIATMIERSQFLSLCPSDAPAQHVHLLITQHSSDAHYNICMAPGNALRLAKQLKHCGEQAYAKLVMKALEG